MASRGRALPRLDAAVITDSNRNIALGTMIYISHGDEFIKRAGEIELIPARTRRGAGRRGRQERKKCTHDIFSSTY